MGGEFLNAGGRGQPTENSDAGVQLSFAQQHLIQNTSKEKTTGLPLLCV